MDPEAEFWQLAANKGLPWFRFFRRSIRPEVLDTQFAGTRLESEWRMLRLKLQDGDKIWPFEFHMRSYLGMRRGYLVLRKGVPLGGILTVIS